MSNNAKSLGLCLGASNITACELIEDKDDVRTGKVFSRSHESNPREVIAQMLHEIDIAHYDYVGITGRKFRDIINAKSITEPEAVEKAFEFIRIHSTQKDWSAYNVIASLGAENFVVYILGSEGQIRTVETGNKCASGTGEFFLQQIRRMDITPDEALALGSQSEPYRVSGRCSVFCKSDCTHALNKGIPVGRVTAGLCEMMSEKVMELLEKQDRTGVIAVGGVTKNKVVMDSLRRKVDSLYIPEHGAAFEAMGAAWYALTERHRANIDMEHIFIEGSTSFSFLPAIRESEDMVRFEQHPEASASDGDECIVGLDVGSTTTKAVLLRRSDDAVLASIYLRTNGNPVYASRQCYKALREKVGAEVKVEGVAVTGSGRYIAGLHAQTSGVINEIIAHATGAAYFDPCVDTIFEIGGQDAKYTYLTNGVPSDYAMNEACSAGTGSFLEESAQESLGISYREIEDIARAAAKPPNFNDQCAAFISSDIKTATHEGIDREDIVAGLVYSICMNYVNRVKGQRRVGKKVFMQGGVCYNKAVPLAMANLVGREIIVPPNPGLMGAFGVALEWKHRIEKGLAETTSYDLQELEQREIEYGKSFICNGGREKCDRGCEINMLIINGKKYPFGGACNKYYNQIHNIRYEPDRYNYIDMRQRMVFHDYAAACDDNRDGPDVGISRSYFTNTYFPLYSTFLHDAGARITLSDDVDSEGTKRKRSAFCYPGEIAHGCYYNLLQKKPEYIFLPRIVELYVEKSASYKKEHNCTCLLLQSEIYWLRSAFKNIATETRRVSPELDFSQGLDTQPDRFVEAAKEMGLDETKARSAYFNGVEKQNEFKRELKKKGKEFLDQLAQDPDSYAVVLFGRPYNAFAHEANMGIPTKFASRGVYIIPWDMLPYEDEEPEPDMCWAVGQELIKTARFVQRHPQLFATFITNFSCGPDSFLVGYFRSLMGMKPSLTLELDSHTADAGVNTRIEAFLDIVERFRVLKKPDEVSSSFTPAEVVIENNKPKYISSEGERVDFHDSRVHVVFPSMGPLGSEMISAAFTGAGMRASAVPVYSYDTLKKGRAEASGKECLPLLLTTGGLMEYLQERRDPNEFLVYFMPTTAGNCRFTQYNVFLKKLVRKHEIKNVAFLSLTTENSYAGLPVNDALNILKGIIVSDVMEDIRNALRVLAKDRDAAMELFDAQWQRIVDCYRTKRAKGLYGLLEDVAKRVSDIALRYPLADAKKVALLGEIFVRRDYFACQDLIDRLVEKDIVVKKAHLFEWLKYIDYMVRYNVYDSDFDIKGATEFYARQLLQKGYERRIKKIFAKSGLFEYEKIDMKKILQYGQEFFDVRFTGEPIVVAGGFFKEILHSADGVISVGPFACMPTRVIEAVLTAENNVDRKMELDEKYAKKNGRHNPVHDGIDTLPFLSVETDGNPFPQIVSSRIEAFCLQVDRTHRKMYAH